MPLTTGDNTVRIAGFRQGVQGIYDIYQFTVVNLKGEVHGFCYAVPAGLVPGQLVRDLLELRRRRLWFVVYLKQGAKGLLNIHTIKEPRQPQNECWHIAQKVIRQTPRTLKELTGESQDLVISRN